MVLVCWTVQKVRVRNLHFLREGENPYMLGRGVDWRCKEQSPDRSRVKIT